MPGILYVVATPIGNLEDVTLRALRILRDVSLIAAEDTRRTGRLLQHYSISTRTTSLHEHNERGKTASLLKLLLDGQSIALVSDAGTPLISDPGQTLVAEALAAGVRVEPIPGPSAVMAALSVCGFDVSSFTFMGFPPVRGKDRASWFERAAAATGAVIIFEAPHRIRHTIGDLTKYCRPGRRVAVGRELTKSHEHMVIRPIGEFVASNVVERGEFTLVLEPETEPGRASETLDLEAARREIDQLTELAKAGASSKRQAVKALAQRYGMSVNELYKLLGD